MAASVEPVPVEPQARRRQLALLAAIMGSFVAGLDATAVNVALPSIAGDLGGGLAGQQWVANGYLLALGSLILVGGSLGDVLGERRVFAAGVTGFGAASLLCAAAPSVEVLVAARVLQGAFGALLTPSALAVIVGAFPRELRGGAIGSWTAWSGTAAVVGPFVGGWLVDAASWRWIFAINVPFVLATLALVRVAIPPRSADHPRRTIDWLGAALGAAGLAGPVFGLIRQPTSGWASVDVFLPIAAGVAFFAAFLRHEATTRDPMLPLRLFGRRNFAVGNVETLAMYGGLGSTFFLLVLFLQQVAGYDALEAGLATVPTTLVMFSLSKRMGALADHFGPRAFMGGGPLLAALGVAWFARMPADVDYVIDVLPGLAVFSLGLTATVAPLTATVLADADASDAGIASGINNAIARVASLMAIAAVGAVVAAAFTTSAGSALAGHSLSPAAERSVDAARRQTMARADTRGVPGAEAAIVASAVERASVHAFHVGMGLSAALIGLGGALGLAGIANPRRRVACAECAGGQLAGAPVEAVEAAGAARTPSG